MIIKTTALHYSGRDRAMRNSETHVPLWRQFRLPQLLITGTFLATTAASMGQPVITTQPQSQTNIASTTATFTVEAAGTPPLGYQWQRDTGYLDFGDLAGRTNATLVLTNVGSADAYNYRAVVTNDSGAITSAVASLTLVYPPKITRLSNYVASASVGASASMRVWASGTAPLSYQWWFKIATLPGQTNYTLNLSNVQATNAGLYSVVVTNVAGSVTSSPVNLDVDPTFTKITAGAVVSAPAFWPTFAWGDYDNDGFLDLFVVNQDWDVGRPVANFLFHNLHDGSFERVTNNTVATDRCFGISGTWGDFDNDGNLDLFVANAQTSLGFSSNTNCLYRNLGNGVFTQITTGPPVNTKNVGNGMWVDYDNDGNLDLFLFKWYGGVGTRTNNLFRNDGDGRFTEVSAGPAQTVDSGNCAAAWGDYDNDGRPDLAIWAFPKSMLCHNEGYGKFSSVTNGFTRNTDYINKLAWADYDNDGRLDLLGVGYGSSGPHAPNHILFHNQGQGQFNTMVLGSYDTGAFCLCSAWGDYDNDGYLDLFVIQGFGQATRNLLFHNNGNGTFTKVATGSPVNEAGDYGTYITWGACAWADYDNDGFLDLLYGSTNGLHLYHNNGNTNHWLTLDLAGTASNRSAIGAKARVKATIGGKTFWQLREVSTGDGFAQGDMRPHFGLGDASLAETVRIEWPSGIVQELQNVAANQFLRITEPPGLRALAASQSSGFQVALTGNVGSRYDLLASTNLLDWTFWQTVTTTNRTTVLTDPAASTASQRFFKAGLHD